MLMKKNYTFFLLLISSTVFAQVGIGTTNPEATLHVAGDNSTIRIEGLNENNNSLNDGIKLAPTYVDKTGELTLSSGNGISSIYILDASNVFSDKVVAENVNSASSDTIIYNYQLTLPSDTFIEVKYSLSYNVYSRYDQNREFGLRIFDGQSRMIKNYFTIDSGSVKYGPISQNYYNLFEGGGSGTFYNNGFAYVKLEAGTYLLSFHAEIAGDVGNRTAVVFGGDESLLRIRFY